MKKQYNSTVDWLRNLFCCGRGNYREAERRLLAQDALVPEVNIPLIAITADSIQEIIDNIIGQAREAPGGIYEAMAQSCFPSARINLDNVRILRSLLAQMATENPGVAVFWDSSIMRGALEIAQRTLNPSAISQWSDFCSLMASLPSIEIFTLQALKVLEALSERPQGGEEPRPGQQCEVNLPKLLEILQESGLGGEGMQILTGLFTPHFQSNAIGVVDLMCTCHALVNYELMTNPTRLACALVNTGVAINIVPGSQAGVKPLGFQGSLFQIDDPSQGRPMVDQLVHHLYNRTEPFTSGGRNPLEVAEVYYGLAVTNGSHALQMTLLSDPLSFVYQLPSGALPDKHSIATLSFTSIARGTFRDSGHAGLALWHPEGRFIFHTNYQDSEKKVIYAGHGTDGVLRQLRWDPQTGTFIEKAPYLLTTHAENSPLQHLESLSLASLGTLLTPGVFQIPIYQICQARATIALCDWLLASNKSLQSVRDLFVFAPTAVSQSGSDDSDDAGDPKEQAHMILAAHWRALSGGDLPFSIQQAAGTAVIDVVQTYPDLGAIRDALGDLKKRSIGDIQTQIGALQAGASPVLKFELSFMHSTS